jgi:(4-(4-[2-(gamma-L-glutamylamino)ethyl]phenoxymethyl)furan-2-yl)methanamine synthase
LPRPVLALDIGGANLKAAHSGGSARSVPFALWKTPQSLTSALRALLHDWPPFEILAVTMTGELCDCFATKREGVAAILDAVLLAGVKVPVRVWLNDGRLVDVPTALDQPLLAAAANWLSLATFAGRFSPRGPALVLDVGSTTTDIIPLLDGRPIPEGRSDPERLHCGELVYTGVRRTPLCALLGGQAAAEFFATTLDVYLVLGQLPEDAGDCDTADGRPATREYAESRLARMICADLETSTHAERHDIAVRAARRQVQMIVHALETVASRLPAPPEKVVLSGSGEFLAEIAWRGQKSCPPGATISLGERLGPEISRAACAYALAVIASESLR